VYTFLYSVFYYTRMSKMNGFFQTSFYFGYIFIICFGFGLFLGMLDDGVISIVSCSQILTTRCNQLPSLTSVCSQDLQCYPYRLSSMMWSTLLVNIVINIIHPTCLFPLIAPSIVIYSFVSNSMHCFNLLGFHSSMIIVSGIAIHWKKLN
jgi:hypothetical protein